MRISGKLTVVAYRDIPDGLTEEDIHDREINLQTDLELGAQDMDNDQNLSDTDLDWDTDYGICKEEDK